MLEYNFKLSTRDFTARICVYSAVKKKEEKTTTEATGATEATSTLK